jgi:acyl transferase domain-containing protein
VTACLDLKQTAHAQPALFAIEYALARQWMRWGVQPQAMIGHSVGEFVAACLAGVFSLGVATQAGLLTQLSTVYLERLPENYLETYRERIRALTADDVLTAARHHFDSANEQIVIVGDREQIAGQVALFGDVETLDAQGHPL